MSMTDTWGELTPGALTGASFLDPDRGSGGIMGTGVDTAVTTRGGPTAPPYSPQNPLFWFVGLAAVVAGAIGVSGWVDVGPIKGKAKI